MPQAADPTAAFTLSHTVGTFKFRRWDCTNSGQRKRSRAPVRSRHVPLSRPQPPQTAAKLRGFSPTAPGFTAETDSPLEREGFEPSVPRERDGPRAIAKVVSRWALSELMYCLPQVWW